MEIHIGDRIADITLVGKEGNKVQLTIDGKPYEVDIVMAENGSCSILHNGNSFNAGLVRGEGGKSYPMDRNPDRRLGSLCFGAPDGEVPQRPSYRRQRHQRSQMRD